VGDMTTNPRMLTSLAGVVVVPRNGLANRLQAWASAHALAQEWDVPLRVVWEPEEVLPASAHDLFAESLVEDSFSSPDLIRELTEHVHQDLPRYLTRLGDVLVLAGHDRGEQAFMDDVLSVIADGSGIAHLIVIAGGNFHLPGARDAPLQRGHFYQNLLWSDQVYERAHSGRSPDPSYLALHIRETDRSLDAPTARAIRAALGTMQRRYPEESNVFITADSAGAVEHWTEITRSQGLTPWSLPMVEHQRTRKSAMIDAAADWLLLSGAIASVHPAASTFSTEAATASGHEAASIALQAPSLLRQMRKVKGIFQAGLTYPERRRRRNADK
jgi:hypothetical protein